MNIFERIRREVRLYFRQRAFCSRSGTSGFKLLPGWKLKTKKIGSGYNSQCAQDWFVDQFVFPDLAQGIFVDIGANHPIEINNTYYFEKKGWVGLAFEPQKEIARLWSGVRNTKCLAYVLGDEPKNVMFEVNSEAHTLSSVSNTENMISSTRQTIYQQRRIDCVLLEFNITHVDFMSIDVEGYELRVLAGLDFSKIDVTCVVLENDETWWGDDSIRVYMLNSGYRHVARLAGDDVFLKIGSAAEKRFL